MTTITRRLELDAGHRLREHESKCRNAHGHRYAFEITVSTENELDGCGRVIDFGRVRELVGGWLDETFDHGFIAEAGDPLIETLRALKMKVAVLPTPPSIENLTRIVFEQASRLLFVHGIRVVKVRGYETPACWADYEGMPRSATLPAPPLELQRFGGQS